MAIADVTLGQLHTGIYGVISVVHIVVLFVTFFDIHKDIDGLLRGGGINHNFLEPAFQGTIFFDMLSVFVKGSGTNTLYLTPGKCRFQHIGRIQRTCSPACSNDGMNLIDEQYDGGIFCQFIKDRFHALLKLSPVLGSGNNGGQIKSNNALVKQYTTHFTLNNPQCKSFGNGRFTYTWFTDQDRVVLFATA